MSNPTISRECPLSHCPVKATFEYKDDELTRSPGFQSIARARLLQSLRAEHIAGKHEEYIKKYMEAKNVGN